MREIFLACLILAVLFLILAAACSLVGFSKIGKDEEREHTEREERMEDGTKHPSKNEPITPADRIIFHEEEDGI